MTLQLPGLSIPHHFNFLFDDQISFLQHLHKQITNERLIATQTQHSFAKTSLLFSYFLAYLQQERPLYTRIIYLCKSQTQIDEANQAIDIVRKTRQKAELPMTTRIEHFAAETMEVEEELVTPPTLVLSTIKEYLTAALHRNLYTGTVRTILYISECDTLDLECEEVFGKDITWLTLYQAMEERDYLLQKNFIPVENDNDAELKALSESLKEANQLPDEISFLSDDRKLLRIIQFILHYFKFKHKQLEHSKKKLVITRKIYEFVDNELQGELFLKSQLLRNLNFYFKQFMRKHNISKRFVRNILKVCEFLETIIIIRQSYEQQYKNAFRIFSNCRLEYQNYIYRLMCVDPKIMFNRIYPKSKQNGTTKYHNERQDSSNVLLILNSYSCLQRDFFYSHFKLQITEQTLTTFVTKNITRQNLSAMSVLCNAFDVDLKSDDYESDNKLQIQRSYGTLVEQLSDIIPDGIVVCISSYKYMLTLITEWSKQKILDKVRSNKMVFFEVESDKQNEQNMELFRKSCDVGRGAIYFLSVRSKALERAKFKGHYSNLVVFLGYPVISEMEIHTKEKLDYLNEKQKAKDYDYLQQDAMRHVNKWMVNLVGESRYERKILLFADARYSMTKIPPWLQVADGNLSISQSIEKCQEFYRRNQTAKVNASIKQSIRLM